MASGKENSTIVHECFHKCDSLYHGSNLTAALTKDELSDEEVAAYLKWCCVRYSKAWDLDGRNLLHLAASKGRLKLLLFLLKHKDVNINEKDKESHYTPLHRSIFYGQIHCAVRLIQFGANMQQLDLEDMTPIDHAMKDKYRNYPGMNNKFSFEDLGIFIIKRNLVKEKPRFIEYNERQTEVYVWGTNTNYNLGTGHHQSRTNPEPLDVFGRHGISIKNVFMSEYHSIFVSHEGQVWSCGHGLGGRLGLDDEITTLVPKVVNVGHEPGMSCVMAALGNDHTVLLLKNKTVWSFGLNNYHQLGHCPPPEKILAPKMIKSFKDNAIVGVSANKYHSAFWSKNQIFTCGLNGGQLGHKKGPKTIVCPKPASIPNLKGASIAEVASSEGAIVMSDNMGRIYLLNKFCCKRIMSSSKSSIAVKICAIGGHLEHKANIDCPQDKTAEELKILVLFEDNMVYWWQESKENGISPECSISLRRIIEISDIALNKDFLLLTTREGEAFQGEVKTKKLKTQSDTEKSSPNKVYDKITMKQRSNSIFQHVHYIKLKRIQNVHRGIKITSDPRGRNFAVTQIHPRSGLRCIPEIESSEMKENLKQLLDTTTDFDNLHDVIFQVGREKIFGHRFIIASSSSVLENMMNEAKEINGKLFVKINKMRADIFRRIITFIYTGDCDLLHLGLCPISIDLKDNKSKIQSKEIVSDDEEDTESTSSNEHDSQENSPKSKRPSGKKCKKNPNPLKLLKRAAKKFGLSDLRSKVENLKYKNNRIWQKNENSKEDYSIHTLKFDRNKFEHLCDITVKSEDGIKIRAHKCILVSRLEYCNALINHPWLESTQKTHIKIPISGRALRVLINYLYTDEAQEVLISEDSDLSSVILIIADQFLCNRLKEVAEFSLAHLLSLRNAAEIFQLAVTYNAKQLKQSAMEFISLNLPTFLESRALEILQDSDLEEITNFYRDWHACMRQRRIATYLNAPDNSLIEMINKTEPVSLEYAEDNTPVKIISKNKKKASKRKNNETEKVRNDPTGSVISEKECESMWSDNVPERIEKGNEWIKVVNHTTKQQKSKIRFPPSEEILKRVSLLIEKNKMASLNKINADKIPNNNLPQQEKRMQEISTNFEKDFPVLNTSRSKRLDPNPGSSRQG